MYRLLSGIFMGWSLGSNDSANIFGTAVFSKKIRYRTAVFLCAIFVILGAILEGQGGMHTLSGLVKESDRASRNLLDALNERHRRTEELLRQMDVREKRITEAIREDERTILRSENSDTASKYKEVCRLADMGLDANEIAGRVKLPKGEIELILGLKR